MIYNIGFDHNCMQHSDKHGSFNFVIENEKYVFAGVDRFGNIPKGLIWHGSNG